MTMHASTALSGTRSPSTGIAALALGFATASPGQMAEDRFGAAGRPEAAARATEPGTPPRVREPIVAALEYDGVGTYGSAAQDYEAAFDCYDITIIEDFSTDQDVRLTSGHAVGFSDTGNPFGATDFVMRIWTDNGTGTVCEPGYIGEVVGSSIPGAGFWDGTQMNTSFDLCLPAGRYFVQYHAVMDYVPHGQVFFYQQAGEHTVGGGTPDDATL